MVETTGIEGLIIDPIQFFVQLGDRKLGIPYITVATTFYLDYFGYTPLCAYDWSHETTPEALLRNQEGIVNCVRPMYNDATKAYAKEADLDHPSWIFSELAYITQIKKGLIAKTFYYLLNSITRDRFMMARVGPKWIFPGSD